MYGTVTFSDEQGRRRSGGKEMEMKMGCGDCALFIYWRWTIEIKRRKTIEGSSETLELLSDGRKVAGKGLLGCCATFRTQAAKSP